MPVDSDCDKTSYTKKQAQTVLNQMQGNAKLARHLPKIPQRIYQCPECNYWHLTSKK